MNTTTKVQARRDRSCIDINDPALNKRHRSAEIGKGNDIPHGCALGGGGLGGGGLGGGGRGGGGLGGGGCGGGGLGGGGLGGGGPAPSPVIQSQRNTM